MRYIIMGASGHIGNNLIRRISGDIKVLLRQEKCKALDGLKLTKAIGDLFDDEFLEKELDGDVVIHLAAMIDTTNQKKDIFKINYELTKKIADICFKKQIRFIFISSVDALVKPKKGLIEDIHLQPNVLKTNYGKSKAMASIYVSSLMKQGMNASIIYPSAVIGPYDYRNSPIGNVIKKIKNNSFIPSIKGQYNFIDVRDVCDIIIRLSKNDLRDSYLVTGDVLTVDDMLKIISMKLHKKPPKKIPMCLVILGGLIVPLIAQIKKEEPTFTMMALRTLNSNCNFSNQKIIKDFNLVFKEAKESLIDMIDWYIENET